METYTSFTDADAELEKTTATISVSGCEDEFQAVGEVVTFDGFLKVYKESFDEEVEQEDATGLPKMEVGEVLQREENCCCATFQSGSGTLYRSKPGA